MANPIIKIKRGSGAPVSLQTGELAIDTLNKSLFVGTAEGVLAIGGEHVFAKKTYVDSAVSAEQSAREAADSTLTSNLAQEVSDRTAAVSAEESARIAADNTLDGKITTEKNRVDAILDAADADKDSFAEIVALINSVDTENDSAFAGYVLSNDAALAAEVSAREAADTALQSDIDAVESDLTALAARVTTAESDITAEESARIAADTTLQSNIDAEASSRATADTSLSNRIDALESASADSRLDDVEADVADHETRITALETTIDGGTY
jgi:hypothetical protein